MLRGLLAAGVQPDFIACYFAGTPTGEGVMGLQRVWSGLRCRDVFTIDLAGVARCSDRLRLRA